MIWFYIALGWLVFTLVVPLWTRRAIPRLNRSVRPPCPTCHPRGTPEVIATHPHRPKHRSGRQGAR